MANFDALFFDMDGTLVENSSLMPGAFKQAFEEAGGYQISLSPWRGSGRTDWEVMDQYLMDYPLTEEEKDAIKEKVAKRVKEIVISQVKEIGLGALPGTVELIAKLNQLGIRPGLLTGNMEEIVGPKLAAAGMKRDDFYYGGFGDHSPRRAITAQRALDSASAFLGYQIDPARALVIGDTPNDIACARSINAKALAVCTGKFSYEQLSEHQPDYILQDLSDIQAFLNIVSGQ